jgi:hypothetical protein
MATDDTGVIDALAVDDEYANFKVRKLQYWRSDERGLYYDLECLTCSGILTMEHGDLVYLAYCPACGFEKFMREQTGRLSELKRKAVTKYREHVQASTALSVEPVDYASFWRDIENAPELADQFPVESTEKWEKALRRGLKETNDTVVPEQTECATTS